MPRLEVVLHGFDDAVSYVRSLPPNDGTIDDATRLSLYGLYKAASAGPPPPLRFTLNVVARAKHAAWSRASRECQGDARLAREKYVARVNELRELY